MKDFFKLLARYMAPYKWNVALNVIFNILAAFLTLFSFAFIIPILQMLFGINTETYSLMQVGQASLKDVVVNNFYYYTGEIIQAHGASAALAMLALLLVLMTLLKTGAIYMSAFCIVPMRNGVVRDIRMQMYRKILSLPIGFFSGERKGDIMARISGDVTEIEASVMSSLDMFSKTRL